MSKAILILDEMPHICEDCIGCLHYLPTKSYCVAKSRFFPNDTDPKDNPPDWCPLRPMPERKQVVPDTYTAVDTWEKFFALGWNQCLDEIESNNELERC